MRIIESCAECLYDKQKHLTDNEEYLKEIKNLIDNRGEDDTSPYLVYLFGQVHEKFFGKRASYKDVKKKYNDLVLSLEDEIRRKIEESENPLETALAYARVGNYIDFGAMNSVDEGTFLSLIEDVEVHDRDRKTIDSFVKQLGEAKTFLLITDNCGEIVLDKLFIEQLKKRFSHLDVNILVRGGEVLNDATMHDAEYVGMDKLGRVISNGNPVAGTVYGMLSDEAKDILDNSDVILAKGQGNYESLCKQGRHIFYSFLCKCELFTSRFEVPKLTGIFVEEV
ncbi:MULTISPECIES: damage-control phosphatase ARMT1 family protein [unclassified Butyrivibrio]|uniref:damage-control phosphatase ARMT1 family protein n=1 Tax=unclassified Butyrivibrio TaxID=2639466 RepID=UPI0004082439|nr:MULTISPECIES: ARMT1-like domain-containing protein [unclassified Butyrivibrio]